MGYRKYGSFSGIDYFISESDLQKLSQIRPSTTEAVLATLRTSKHAWQELETAERLVVVIDGLRRGELVRISSEVHHVRGKLDQYQGLSVTSIEEFRDSVQSKYENLTFRHFKFDIGYFDFVYSADGNRKARGQKVFLISGSVEICDLIGRGTVEECNS